MFSLTVDIHYLDAAFKESEHHRGQPGNKGQFGPGGASSPYLAGARKPGNELTVFPSSKSRKLQLQGWGKAGAVYERMKHSDAFAKTLNNMPQYSGPLWRGEKFDAAEMAQFKPGKSVTMIQNTPTSPDAEEAKLYLPAIDESGEIEEGKVSVLFHIIGSHGADLKAAGFEQLSQEVVVPKGRKFMVQAVAKDKDLSSSLGIPVHVVTLKAV